MSDDRYIDKLTMSLSAPDALKAVPDQLVKEIVADHSAPTPARPKSIIDALVEKFGMAD